MKRGELGKKMAESPNVGLEQRKKQVKSESVSKKFGFSKIKAGFGKITRRRIKVENFNRKRLKKNLSIKMPK